ncbi:MAG: hypothetical protein ACOCTG_03925 [Bacteroidota bacterium]
MPSSSVRLFLIVVVAAALTACSRSPAEHLTITELVNPALPGSGQPFLTTSPGGAVYLSWIEQEDESAHRLVLVRLDGDEFQPAGTIAEGSTWFVNWADFPAVSAVSDSALIAHYLQKSDDSPYAYHVMLTHSRNGGLSWSNAQRLHTEDSATEHGFVSMAAMGDEELQIVWLDGREMTGTVGHDSEASMTLRSAVVDAHGRIDDRRLIDDRVCDCCQTSVVQVGNSLL